MERSLEAGASLVEISIAIVIVGLTAVLIFGFSRNSFTMLSDARGSETASLIAEEKYIEMSAQAFPSNGSDTVLENNTVYSRIWSVKDTGFIKMAIVTVTYEVGQRKKSVNFMGALN